MEPRITTLTEKTLIGMHRRMSIADDQTFELWRGFMPRRGEIANTVSNDLFSVQIFPSSFDFSHFDPHRSFEKWATVEVSEIGAIPAEMDALTLPTGLYAVFRYKGMPSDGPKIFGYIFGTWLPQSGYNIDARPQFEVLGEKYKQNDPSSEEDIWIPIKRRS